MEASAPIFDTVSYALERADGSKTEATQKLFIDAKKPSRALGAAELQRLVRILIAGFRVHGVQSGDCVLVHMGNHVWPTSSLY